MKLFNTAAEVHADLGPTYVSPDRADKVRCSLCGEWIVDAVVDRAVHAGIEAREHAGAFRRLQAVTAKVKAASHAAQLLKAAQMNRRTAS